MIRRRAPAETTLLLYVTALGWLASCGPAPGAQSRQVAVLRVPLARDILTLDPLRAEDITTYNVVRQIYEGLLDYDPRTLAIVPRLARSWSVSPDGLSWRFELEEDVRFVDDPCFPAGRGRKVVADDARYAIERCVASFRGPSPRPELPAIAGLAEFLGGSSDHVEGILAESDGVLLIRLVRPDPLLPHFLVRPCCRLVPREAVTAYGDELRVHAVGTGPFRLVHWQPLSGVLLVRNRRYWGRDESGAALPSLDAVRFIPGSPESQLRLYAQGRLDMTGGASSTPVRPRSGDTPAHPVAEQPFFVPRLNTIFVRFDYSSAHPVVRDPRLRRALACAVPRPTGGTQRPARGLLPPGLPGHDPSLDGQRTDLAEGARLLEAASHSGGCGLPPLRLAWREWDAAVGDRIARALRGLGLRVELAFHPDAEYWGAVGAGRADLFRAGWVADYPDPQTFLELFYSGAASNSGRYSHAGFDALFEAFRVETDLARRLELAGRMERLLVDDAAALFLLHEGESHLVSPRVENWEANGTNPLSIVFYERLKVLPLAGRPG